MYAYDESTLGAATDGGVIDRDGTTEFAESAVDSLDSGLDWDPLFLLDFFEAPFPDI